MSREMSCGKGDGRGGCVHTQSFHVAIGVQARGKGSEFPLRPKYKLRFRRIPKRQRVGAIGYGESSDFIVRLPGLVTPSA